MVPNAPKRRGLRSFLWGFLAGFLTFLLLLAGAAAWIFFTFIQPNMGEYWKQVGDTQKVPTELEKPGVRLGQGVIGVKTFVASTLLDNVSKIRRIESGKQKGRIGILGNNGFLLVDDGGQIKHQVSFKCCLGDGDFIDVEGDGQLEYYGSASWGPAFLLNGDGSIRWEKEEGPGVNSVAAGDVDRDGAPEFVVGYNGAGGLHMHDASGKQIWKQSGGNIWRVVVVDANEDGQLDIVHSDANGSLTVRNKSGEFVSRSMPPEGYLSHFGLTNWPNRQGALHALHLAPKVVNVLNFQSRVVGHFEVPECTSILGEPIGAHAKISRQHPEVFVLSVAYSQADRSLFVLFDKTGKRLYSEVLPFAAGTISVMPDSKTGFDRILVGAKGKVLEYRPNL